MQNVQHQMWTLMQTLELGYNDVSTHNDVGSSTATKLP